MRSFAPLLCHPERSEGPLVGGNIFKLGWIIFGSLMFNRLQQARIPAARSFASLRMTAGISCSLLLVSSVLGRKLDKHVFERRADFVNLRVTDAYFAQLFVNLGALDALIDQQMH